MDLNLGTNANCGTAFHKPSDTFVQVGCPAANVSFSSHRLDFYDTLFKSIFHPVEIKQTVIWSQRAFRLNKQANKDQHQNNIKNQKEHKKSRQTIKKQTNKQINNRRGK